MSNPMTDNPLTAEEISKALRALRSVRDMNVRDLAKSKDVLEAGSRYGGYGILSKLNADIEELEMMLSAAQQQKLGETDGVHG